MSAIRVTLLTADGCHFCAQAKDVLKRLANEWPLEVEEVPITSTAGSHLALRDGILFAPGVYVDGAFVGYGRLSEGKLRKYLSQLRPR